MRRQKTRDVSPSQEVERRPARSFIWKGATRPAGVGIKALRAEKIARESGLAFT